MDSLWIILIAILVSINGSLAGSFLVLRKSAMMGDAISHAVLPGIAISYLITKSISSITMIVGATFTGVIAIFLIGFINKRIKLQIDASIGIVFTFLFALGVILISTFTQKVDLDQECVLFGEILYAPLNVWITKSGIVLGPKSFYILLSVLLINISVIFLCYRQFYITSFDEDFAKSIGIKTLSWNYLILTLTALTTVASFESVGTILIICFLVVPTSAAYLISKSVKNMIILSSIFGISSSILGYYFAVYINADVTGSMCAIGTLLFFLCFIITQLKKNVVSKY